METSVLQPDDAESLRQDLAMQAWELMGGEINWLALPLMVELLGVDDVRRLITHLCAIRDHVAALAKV